MSGAAWWVVLASAAVGAAAAMGGNMWASRVQRRSAGRAEWFRRLQWAWELTQRPDVPSVNAGIVMMDYLADATDRKDATIIDGLAPIAREVGQLAAQYPGPTPGVEIHDIDSPSGGSHTEKEARHEDGE